MKIALIGSAPSSIRLAPFNDPSWLIWGCSPGAYPVVSNVAAWFELHRWEPPVIGKADQQKPWFSPEYCLWLGQQPVVWMIDPVKELPNSKRYPFEQMVRKYGPYFFTSSVAWMFAMAIEAILEDRQARPVEPLITDEIGLWGIDMATTDEYGYQRAGCQFFAQIAQQLDINVVIPHESDLLMPPPLYGVVENDPMMIKLTTRKQELVNRLNGVNAALDGNVREKHFLEGAIDDLTYIMGTWIQLDSGGVKLKELFGEKAPMDISGPDSEVIDLSKVIGHIDLDRQRSGSE